MRAEIVRAQESIARVTGSLPRFFRAPAGLRNPFLDPVLNGLELRLASWTRRGFDTVNRDPETVYRRLAKSLRGGDILLLHDGNAAFGAEGSPVILDVLPRLLATLRAERLTPITLRAALEVTDTRDRAPDVRRADERDLRGGDVSTRFTTFEYADGAARCAIYGEYRLVSLTSSVRRRRYAAGVR